MQLVGPDVLALEALCRAGHRCIHIALLRHHPGGGRIGADGCGQVIERLRPGRVGLPLHPQRLHGGVGLVFTLGDDADEVADDHQLDDARQVGDGRFVHRQQAGADERAGVQPGIGRAQHPAMQHAGPAHVVHIDRLAGGLGGQVDPRRAGADHGVVGHRLGGGGQVQQQVDMPAGQQAGGGQLAAVGRHQQVAVTAQLIGGHAQLGARLGQQPRTRLRRRHAQRLGMQLQRCAGDRRPLVGRAAGVTQDDLHGSQRQAQLLGHDLAIGGADAGAQVDMAGQGGGRQPAIAFVHQRQQDLGPLGRVAGHGRRLALGGLWRHGRVTQHQQHAGGGAEVGAQAPGGSAEGHAWPP